MAFFLWRGDAPVIAQTDTITVGGTWAADGSETARFTNNGRSIAITLLGGHSTANADIAANFAAILNGDDPTDTNVTISPSPLDLAEFPEFGEITFSAATNIITAIGNKSVSDGRPFVLTEDVVSAAGTLTPVTTIAGQGPNHWIKINFTIDGVAQLPLDPPRFPTTGDTVLFRDNAIDLLYDLENGGSSDQINFHASYTGNVGLPETNDNGYTEPRERYLQHTCPIVNIGQGDGAGSGRMQIDVDTSATVWNVESSGSPPTAEDRALLIAGGTIASTLEAHGNASIDVAKDSAHVATLGSIAITGGASVRVNPSTVFDSPSTITVQNTATLDIEGNFPNTAIDCFDASFLISRGTALGKVRFEGSTWTALGTLTIDSHDLGQNISLDLVNAVNLTATNVGTAVTPLSINDPAGAMVAANGIVVTGNLADLDYQSKQTTTIVITN